MMAFSKINILTAFFSLLIFTTNCIAKNKFIKEKYSNTISFYKMDSTHTSYCTVVEYDSFLALIELPFIDEGGNKKTELKEDSVVATDFYFFLQKEYKNKPINYVMHSHWHLHSLSGISPFLKRGAKLVTSTSNWQYSIRNGLLDNQPTINWKNNIILLEKDSTFLTNSTMPITALFLDSSYINKPTKDYLFFYFPAIKTLHASCMCAINEVDLVSKKKFLYSDRLTDVQKAITNKNIEVATLFKLNTFEKLQSKSSSPSVSYQYFKNHIKDGTSLLAEKQLWQNISLKKWKRNKEKIISKCITEGTNPQILNSLAYDCIRKKQFEKAIAVASVLTTLTPFDISFLDTLGECYFAAGDFEKATYFAKILAAKDNGHNHLTDWQTNAKNGTY